MSEIQWSPQQEEAIREAVKWHKESDQQVFKIFGFAGTGKTTLAKEIDAEVKGKTLYGAFTGKAASVMRKKGCRGASTIHSMIYRIKDENAGVPEFELNPESDLEGAELAILDECSMLGEEIGKDLLSFGTKILVLGDPAQLPPISGTGFFTSGEPDIMLTEVHRQARDNPIIAMSMRIREGQQLEVGTYGESRVISRADMTTADVMETDQIIVGLNRTRQRYNARLRELHGRKTQLPEHGDKLVCLKNDRREHLFNGTLWKVQNVKQAKANVVPLSVISEDDDDGKFKKKIRVREEFFYGSEASLAWQDKRGTQEFTYGYALTCHKSQGSQWNNIVVFNESAAFRDDAKRWLYTAVTRAAEKVTVII